MYTWTNLIAVSEASSVVGGALGALVAVIAVTLIARKRGGRK